VLIKGTPAEVCEGCGEYYLDEVVARKAYAQADEAKVDAAIGLKELGYGG
jgi:hypothetical protein